MDVLDRMFIAVLIGLFLIVFYKAVSESKSPSTVGKPIHPNPHSVIHMQGLESTYGNL